MASTREPQWYDSMYNNQARVPEAKAHLAQWAERSAEVRQSAKSSPDVAYGEEPGDRLDIFPAAGANAPVLVFLHGGYWRSLDKSDHSFVAPALTAAGACVVVPNYDLCPAVTIPRITLQTVSALAWTWRNIAQYGGNPARITVAGHSAGGHLAAMMLDLGRREINELHVEAGSKLNGSLIRAGLVDEFLIYLAPKLLGPGQSMAVFGPLASLADAVALQFQSIDRVGVDLRILARVAGRGQF